MPAFASVSVTKPTCIVSPPGDTRRLFVCEKYSGYRDERWFGKIKVIPDVTAATAESYEFLELNNLATFDDQGVLGLAFHPNYGPNPVTQNAWCYVFYSWKEGASSYSRLSRFTVLNPATMPTADPASELVLIQQLDRAGFHPGGDLHFGPDGYLYISLGDEGFYNDSFGNAQHLDGNFFSAIARIDVDKKPGNLVPNLHSAVPRDAGVARYAVPADNPFVGASSFNGLPVDPDAVWTEFWAVGFRHPWRFSFDSLTSELWVGDVGEVSFEEVDLVTRGGNYGWSFREGMHNGPKSGTQPPGFASIDPIFEYPHLANGAQACVIGGFVYRGSRISALNGHYVFGDYITGDIWAAERTGPNSVSVHRIAGQTGIAAFGSDPSNGDVLIADNDNDRLLRLTATSVTNNYPETLSATGLFTNLANFSPASGVLPYAPNLDFWSDYAIKSRWFTIPEAASTMTWSSDGLWTFPNGTIWVKHFDLETTRGDPATKRRIETRLLVKNATGAYGVSYRWNDAQTDATLVPDEGADLTLNITDNGTPHEQSWHIPSRAECLACHRPAAGYALSFTTRQLNRTYTINGIAGNQLDLLRDAGYFASPPGSTNLLPRYLRPDETAFSLEARVRSYLAVNCAHCHRPGVAGLAATWDGRPELTLEQTGLSNDLASRVWNHMAAANGFTRMPPLGTSELDQTNLNLVADWISNELPDRRTFVQWQQLWFGSTTAATAQTAADPDRDGHSNGEEFLAGTSPLDGGSFVQPSVTVGSESVNLSFHLPANRSAQIEASTDLQEWNLWDVPDNNGLPAAGGVFSISADFAEARQFFRLRLREN
ncbi:MAG: PQQ-dependent sugar dehydrogenase [Chthoniobacteraceae bacterium]